MGKSIIDIFINKYPQYERFVKKDPEGNRHTIVGDYEIRYKQIYDEDGDTFLEPGFFAPILVGDERVETHELPTEEEDEVQKTVREAVRDSMPPSLRRKER